MKKKFIAALMGMVTITMLTINFSVLSNSKTGDTILDLLTVAQADAEENGCYVIGQGFWRGDCYYCYNTSCNMEVCYFCC